VEMNDMHKIETELCGVLHDIANSGIHSAGDVETTKHALSGLVKLKCLEEMEGYEGDKSGRSYRSYEGDGSYRRGRYMDGGSYRHYDGGDLQQRLQDMMRNASDRDKEAIRQMLSRM